MVLQGKVAGSDQVWVELSVALATAALAVLRDPIGCSSQSLSKLDET